MNIDSQQQHIIKQQKKADSVQVEEYWKVFRYIRNNVKQEIKKTKYDFHQRAFSSEQPEEEWNVIPR